MYNVPLVSVCVITYNSSAYVLETLDSVRRQTYQNIELVISDDCSTDNTVDTCRKWIWENEERFVGVIMVTSNHNTGIAPNCNRAYRTATGEWIKPIAGDDILLDNCIQDNIDYVLSNPEAKVAFSEMQSFKNNAGERIYLNSCASTSKYFKLSSEEQFKTLLTTNFIPAPTAFIKLECLKLVDYADERFPFLDDYPLWLRFLHANIGFSYFHKQTVLYRQEDSITRSRSRFIHPKYLESLEQFHKKIIFPMLSGKLYIYKIHMRIFFVKAKTRIYLFGNKKNVFSIWLLRLLNIIDPYFYFVKMRK